MAVQGVKEDLELINLDADSSIELASQAPIALKNGNIAELEEIRRVLRVIYNRSVQARDRIISKNPPNATLSLANNKVIIIRDNLIGALATDTPDNLLKKQIVAETQCKSNSGGEWCALNDELKKRIALLTKEQKKDANDNLNEQRKEDELLNSGLNVSPEDLEDKEITFFDQVEDSFLSLIGLGSDQTPEERIENALKSGVVLTVVILLGWAGLNIIKNVGPLGALKVLK